MERTIHLVYERDTKRLYGFREVATGYLGGPVYVKKDTFPSRPRWIEIILRTEDRARGRPPRTPPVPHGPRRAARSRSEQGSRTVSPRA